MKMQSKYFYYAFRKKEMLFSIFPVISTSKTMKMEKTVFCVNSIQRLLLALHLKECELRYNHRNDDLFKVNKQILKSC